MRYADDTLIRAADAADAMLRHFRFTPRAACHASATLDDTDAAFMLRRATLLLLPREMPRRRLFTRQDVDAYCPRHAAALLITLLLRHIYVSSCLPPLRAPCRRFTLR